MKNGFVNRSILAIVFLVFGTIGSASAGIINTLNDSYIDTNTGLEWMDLGMTGSDSYNQVKESLSTKYNGWELASEGQVLSMLKSAFSGKGALTDETDSVVGDYYSRYQDRNNSQKTSLFDDQFLIMGLTQIGVGMNSYFENAQGGMSKTYFRNWDKPIWADIVATKGKGNIDNGHYRINASIHQTTYLVRSNSSVIAVPEPATLFILCLSLLALNSFRLTRKNHL